jgi:hypothetical protein
MLRTIGASIATLAALAMFDVAHATPFDVFQSYGPATSFIGATITIDPVDYLADPLSLGSFNPADVRNYVVLTPLGTVADTLHVSNSTEIVFTSTEDSPIALAAGDIPIGTVGGSSELGLRLLSDPAGAVLGLTISTGRGAADQVSIEVPEPASLSLIGASLAALGLLRRRRD